MSNSGALEPKRYSKILDDISASRGALRGHFRRLLYIALTGAYTVQLGYRQYEFHPLILSYILPASSLTEQRHHDEYL